MKSVGEIMAIGRTFEEVIQKGIRMTGLGMHGFVGNKARKKSDIEIELSQPTDQRIFAIADAFEAGYTVDQIHDLTRIDKWFLEKLSHIHDVNEELEKYSTPESMPDRITSYNVCYTKLLRRGAPAIASPVSEGLDQALEGGVVGIDSASLPLRKLSRGRQPSSSMILPASIA